MPESNEAAAEQRIPTGVSRRGVVLGASGAVGALALGGLWTPTALAADVGSGVAVLQFHTMAPVTGAFVGAPTNPDGGTPIRGIHGGGLPWKLKAASGELHADGSLRVRVRGLVLAAGPSDGRNPVTTFRAIVSFENAAPIFTESFPASQEGDAEIKTRIDLPHPGFAPIIFVGPGAFTAWFAVTGVM
ncbi:MAG TPA: hypothetical protein VFN78_12370 [Ktedonobacterales bacterium]|nr:hypothetical protein [Ktedonobacterales bacterium]